MGLHRNYTLRRSFPAGVKSRIYVEIVHYVSIFLLAQNSPAGASEWFTFCANSDLRRNCTLLKIVLQAPRNLFSFGASLGLTWEWKSPDIPSPGFLLVSPRWGLLCLFVCGGLHFPPLGVYYSSPFLGNYINHQMKYFLRSHRPSRRPRTYIRLQY